MVNLNIVVVNHAINKGLPSTVMQCRVGSSCRCRNEGKIAVKLFWNWRFPCQFDVQARHLK